MNATIMSSLHGRGVEMFGKLLNLPGGAEPVLFLASLAQSIAARRRQGLLKDILLPSERIRPGYETTLVQTADGTAITGNLKDDRATSVTLALPNGVEQGLLRKGVTGVRRLATSLMPSFAEGLTPADVANVLAWLRSNLGTNRAASSLSK